MAKIGIAAANGKINIISVTRRAHIVRGVQHRIEYEEEMEIYVVISTSENNPILQLKHPIFCLCSRQLFSQFLVFCFLCRYSSRLTLLALPSVIYEPRFRGSIRNLVYSDQPNVPPRRQEVKLARDAKVRVY